MTSLSQRPCQSRSGMACRRGGYLVFGGGGGTYQLTSPGTVTIDMAGCSQPQILWRGRSDGSTTFTQQSLGAGRSS
jgi:hypothetical protein